MERKKRVCEVTSKDSGLTIYFKKMINKKLSSMDRDITDFENTTIDNVVKAVEGMSCLDFSTGEEFMAFIMVMRDLFSRDVIEGTKLNLNNVSSKGYIDNNFRYKKSDSPDEIIDTHCYDIIVNNILFTSNRQFTDKEYAILTDKFIFEAKIRPKIRRFVKDKDGIIKMSEAYSDSTILYINNRDEVCIKCFFSTLTPVEVVLVVDDDNNVYLIATRILQEFINFSGRRPKYDYEDDTKLAHNDYNLKELYCRGKKVSIFSFVD